MNREDDLGPLESKAVEEKNSSKLEVQLANTASVAVGGEGPRRTLGA